MNKNYESNDTKKNKSPNRDPITKEPGAHPVGTGVGAIAGGAVGVGAATAAGAAAGSVAGPIGTGIGAAAGAVIGGLGGKAVAEHMNPTGSEWERLLDYTVVDSRNDKVGSVDAVWQDHTGQPAYLAVKTGWLGMGKAHVIPAQAADVSESTRKIRLPYTAEMVKGAPSFDSQGEIDTDAERRIADYYGGYGFKPDMATDVHGESCGCDDDHRKDKSTDKDEIRMQLTEEEVKVGKREVEVGGVRLRKIIRTETVNQPITLQREEIVVERVPVSNRTPTRTDVAFREEEIYMPLRREEPVVEKTARTTEEIRVGKKRNTEQREITETVRKEDVDIQQQGEAKSRLPGARR